MRLTFYGGVQEVTGANYLLEAGDTRILIDCGLHQGGYFCDPHNWDPFPYDPKTIDAVFVTHAHIDHTGRLPKLVKDGFRGKIYSTPPTKDFSNLLLLDSEHVLMEDAEKHKMPPLYGIRDVEELMAKWEGIPYHQPISVGPLIVKLFNAGHILGSSVVQVEGSSTGSGQAKRILFSGDLGNNPAPIIGPWEIFEEADYAVIESAYGDRLHEAIPDGFIENIIEETAAKKGTLMIPAFAMERTQKLLFEINELVENGRVPKIPVYLDSPLAIKITEVYKKYQGYFDAATKKLLRGDDMLFDFPGLHKTFTTEESKAINEMPAPKIIIAGSGMSNGGRILHHEKRYLPDPNSTILFIGYQSKSSLGRRILDGEKSVKIHGEQVAVRCRVVSAGGYSAHADQRQLLEWLSPMRTSLKKVFVVQGEPEASAALAQKAVNDLAISAIVPEKDQTVDI